MNWEQVKSFLQVTIAGAGGPLTDFLLAYGMPQTKVDAWVKLSAYVIPFIGAGAWAIYDRMQAKTIADAAKILTTPALDGNKSGTVVINREAIGVARDAATNEDVANVDFGNVKNP